MQPRPSQPIAAPAPAAEPLDLVFIEGLSGQTVIGIHDSELHRPQPIVIDLYAGVPRSRACDSDRIDDTIDYSVVRERVGRLLREHRACREREDNQQGHRSHVPLLLESATD